MKWAVTEKFRDYLYGRPFHVLTDSNPLTYLTTTAKLNATDHRWLSSLSTFDFTISYRAGKANGDADGLSRIHARGDDHETQETPKEEYLNPFLARIIPNNEESAGHLSSEAFQGLCLFYGTNEPFSSDEIQAPAVEAVYMSSEAVPTDSLPRHEELFSWSSNDWRRLQDQDRVIAHVLRILHSEQECTSTRGQRSQLPKDVYCLLREKRRLVIQDGILYRTRHNDGEERLQLVLPKAIRNQALRGLHDEVGHLGRDRTLDLVRQRFYWPSLSKDVEDYLRNCERCVKRKARDPLPAPLVPINVSEPMELLAMHFLSLETGKGGYENILVVTDAFTKFSWVFPTRNQKATTVANLLWERY